MGLKHGFTLLERKGLDQASTKGLFHDNLERALYHILEAHIRDCWTMVGSVAQLQDLRQALMVMEDAGQADELKTQATMFMRDMLQYVVLDQAIKYGDIGLMEAMLPHLLVRFVGGRNSHYATECLELLQGLHREWPPVQKATLFENTVGLLTSAGNETRTAQLTGHKSERSLTARKGPV